MVSVLHPEKLLIKLTTRAQEVYSLYFLFVSFYSPLSPPVSEPLTNKGVLLSTLLQDILHPSHYLLNVLLQVANKLGILTKKNLLQHCELLSPPPPRISPFRNAFSMKIVVLISNVEARESWGLRRHSSW
jgi:hypothetical protein